MTETMRVPTGKRIIIRDKKLDLYINLPATPEGFEILHMFFDMQTAGKNNATQTAVMA